MSEPYHGYSGPCPTPAPKPPQKATCETHGHIYGHEGVCLFCRTPKPTQAPQTVCAWREDRGNRYAACLTASGVVVPHTPIPTMDQWRACPYCTLPLTLSPESPNEGAK